MTDPSTVADIADAVARFGRGPARITPLRPAPGPPRSRASFRLDFDGGGVAKARRLESEAVAQRQVELRAGLPEAFAPVVARFGPILIEAWIDGETLDRRPLSAEPVRRAGALLAALHRRRHAGGRSLPFSADVDGLTSETLSGLQALAGSGILDGQAADLLGSVIRGSAPADVPHCLIHTDFCGENMVVCADGRLFVIDNEHFRFGPAAMDLARSRYRWGWPVRDAPGWGWFREGYESAGGVAVDPRHEPFWRIAAVVVSARVRLQDRNADLAVPVNVLGEMAAEFGRAGGADA